QDVVNNCAKTKPAGYTNMVWSGQWIGVDRWESGCAYWNNQFTYPDADITNQCTAPGRRNKSKQCKNWPGGWMASQNVVNLCQQNKTAGSYMLWRDQWIGAEWIVDDASCNPSFYGNDWNNDGCQSDGTRRWARRVDTK